MPLRPQSQACVAWRFIDSCSDDRDARHHADAFQLGHACGLSQPRVLIVLFLGFSAGLPLALSGSTPAGLDARKPASTSAPSGCLRWSARPTRIKFLWAPVVDALDVPVLRRCSAGGAAGWCSRSSC